MKIGRTSRSLLPQLLLAGLMTWGCASKPSADWAGRVGSYSFNDAVRELGEPEQLVTLPDGGREADWLLRRGTSGSSAQATWRMGDISTIGTFRDTQLGPDWKKSRPATPDRLLRLTFGADAKLSGSAEVTR